MKTKNKKSKWWKYLLGLGALTIAGGVVAGGVVSCSNGSSNSANATSSSTTTSTNSSSSNTASSTSSSSTSQNSNKTNSSSSIPSTTSDYTLVPQAQKRVIYNVDLENKQTSTTAVLATTNSPSFLPLSSLKKQEGLDVYVAEN